VLGANVGHRDAELLAGGLWGTEMCCEICFLAGAVPDELTTCDVREARPKNLVIQNQKSRLELSCI
jgi:hypothetical protein